MSARLTKPLLTAIAAALNAALAGEFAAGDFDGMNRGHFERALAWADEQLAKRKGDAMSIEYLVLGATIGALLGMWMWWWRT